MESSPSLRSAMLPPAIASSWPRGVGSRFTGVAHAMASARAAAPRAAASPLVRRMPARRSRQLGRPSGRRGDVTPARSAPLLHARSRSAIDVPPTAIAVIAAAARQPLAQPFVRRRDTREWQPPPPRRRCAAHAAASRADHAGARARLGRPRTRRDAARPTSAPTTRVDRADRSGSRSRTSPFGQSIIEKLLDGAHRVVIVHARRTLRRADRVGDLLVRHPLTHSKHEHLALRR